MAGSGHVAGPTDADGDTSLESVLRWAFPRVVALVSAAGRSFDWDGPTIDDVVADVWASLEQALEKYDPDRGAIEPFLFACVRNRLRRQIGAVNRQRGRDRQLKASTAGRDIGRSGRRTLDPVTDERIAQLARALMREPAEFLTARQVRTFRAMEWATTDRRLAVVLGVSETTALRRRRELEMRIRELARNAIEEAAGEDHAGS